MSKISTFAYFIGLDKEYTTPLDAELRPNSSLFTDEKTDYYTYGFGPYPYCDITGILALKNMSSPSDVLKYIQYNQSPKLNGNAGVSTDYYAIAGIRSKVKTELDQNPFCNFIPDYSSYFNFIYSIAQALAIDNTVDDLESIKKFYDNDNAVELLSQLGVKIEGGFNDAIKNKVEFKRMALFVSTNSQFNKPGSVMKNDLYHIEILKDVNMHNVICKYLEE